MASTSQSALEYIRSSRVHLVGRLQSLSVIVENLYQQGVLNEEEVSKIQTETDDFDKTRKILDWVINKGEEACYELLKIIDMTRKRTLERPPSLPEKPGLASTQSSKFDLHYWISCFSFREDTEMDVTYLKGPKPCHKYQAKLKSKAQKISDDSWIKSKAVLSNNTNPNYTSLVLDTQGHIAPSKIQSAKSKKSKKIRSKKLRTYIPEDKKGISPSDLLKTDEKNILLVGKPGIGKTAVTHQMLKLWAERDNKELDYMFYFDMRETSYITSTMSLEDLLFSVFREPDEGKEEVLQDIKENSENVLIIFDGVTDLLSLPVVRGLVEKDLLPNAKIVMTCRPEVESEDFLLEWASLRVEVKGFSQQSIKAYLSKMLSTEHLSSVVRNLELFTLCHVPMYALMVVACFSFKTSKDSQQPCTVTEIYINILRFCIQINNSKTKNKHLNHYISNKREAILSLAEVAFRATQAKSVNLEEDSCVHFGFLKKLEVRVGPTEWKTSSAFLHYTMQEFFAGLWLLKNPEDFPGVVQQCLTEGTKHMKHLVPFMCGLLNDKNLDMLKCLIPAEQVKETSKWLFKEVVNTFVPCLLNQDHSDTEGSELDINILFLCQCLYESQSTEACLYLLDKLDYCLDLSEESLDPYHCCAVSYVISQSKERKIRLNLEDVMISEQGLKLISGCLKNVQWCDSLQQQLWTVLLLSEGEMDYSSFLGLGGNELHLPVFGKRQLFERAVKVMQESTERVILCLHWDRRTPVCPALSESLLESVLYINTLSFRNTCTVAGSQDQEQHPGTLEMEEKKLLLDLCLKAALYKRESFHNVVNTLFSLFSVHTERYYFLLDLHQHIKSQGDTSVIPLLRPLYQSAAVWAIDLSERKASLLLEVLKLQSGKKPVELRGWSDEESEVWSFLQCLPHISQLRFTVPQNQTGSLVEGRKKETFLMNLCLQAALHERTTIQSAIDKVFSLSACWYEKWDFLLDLYSHVKDYETLKAYVYKEYQCDFLLDLYSHVKDYETLTGRSVLPALQSVYQSAPAVWSIKLSERKASLLLEVLKLQSEKKPVMLRGWSDEESEVWSFLQCLPHISQLSLAAYFYSKEYHCDFLLDLCSHVKDYETLTAYVDKEYQCDFLLDLYSHVKDYETLTGRSVLPALQSVYQSAPAVWSIDLSERKASLLLEVLKLQSEKKAVELRGWSDEESEVWSFLQCLPHISLLR
ncbi:nucleotide-binding oligomerization domain-containing protein 1-like [Centroberyx affinis]|uniref:nucleotide-binding oligomerization domain-containing protein 1-like n=1 Tax=Centroberyx affinis TaxID=166261 RepID=UPI003A5BAE33